MIVSIVGDVHLTDTLPKSRKDPDYLGTLLDKLSFVYGQSDIVIFLGDLFDKPNIVTRHFYRVIHFFMDQFLLGKKTFSIMGNHDIPHLNPNDIRNTSLGILGLFRLVNLMGTNTCIGPLSIDTIPISSKAVIPDPSPLHMVGGIKVLLGHAFYENMLDPDFSLQKNDVVSSGYKYVFLGHDHQPYPVEEFTTVKLYRPGSVCRNTSHAYQLCRTPGFIRLTLDESSIQSIEEVEFNALPPESVFREEVFKSPEKNDFSFLLSPEKLLEDFRQMTNDTFSSTILSVLRDMNTPDNIILYLRKKYTELGTVLR